MALVDYELRDVRAKITAVSDQMLDACSRSSGKDKSELIREIVHAWYLNKWNEHQMIARLFRGREGADGAPGGDITDA